MSAPAVEAGRTQETPAPTRLSVLPLLRRLHFYAGVLVGPFLVVAAASGMLFALAPQIDDVLYGDVLAVSSEVGTPRPLADQVAAARAAVPDGTVTGVLVAGDPDATTRVVFAVPGLPEEYSRTAYVNPYTAEAQGQLTTWFGSTPATTWMDNLHSNLNLGVPGTLYSELAASWLWVLALVGLVLWVVRKRTARRRALLVPEKGAKGVRRTRSWHASIGTWALLGALFLSATGLTWSTYAGENFTAALTALDAKAPVLDTALPGGTSATAGSGEHAATVAARRPPRRWTRRRSTACSAPRGARGWTARSNSPCPPTPGARGRRRRPTTPGRSAWTRSRSTPAVRP
ncbi:MAG TPA: PepSY-associated TM helix domain-containing protein [Umezawaea sp.]|nr:PepSY-associated TM helix domain-containing protein [Umezawaea sp.]